MRTADAAVRRRLTGALFLLLLLLVSQPAALVATSAAVAPKMADSPVATRFEVFGFAGMRVLAMHTLTGDGDGRYAVRVDYTTQGLARVFDSLATRAEVHGRLGSGAAQPLWFRSESRRDGVDRFSRIDYLPDGRVYSTTTPPLAAPVAPAGLRGTVDNLTAYFRLERRLALTGSCLLTARVWDGRHGYDLAFSDAGRQLLAPAGGQNFAGEAIACRMTRHIWPGLRGPEEDEGARAGTIWYARLVPGDLLVPVRMQLDTQLGVVDGFLAALHGRGVDLALMQ